MFLKACCKWTTEQNTRCFKKCKTKDLTQIAKNKIFAPSNNYKILGIVFAKTDLSKETKRDFKKRYILYEFQEQSFQGVCKKMSLKISQNSQENTCVGVSFLKSCRPERCNFVKRRLQHRCLPVNFAKNFNNLFCRTSANRCFWNFFVET